MPTIEEIVAWRKRQRARLRRRRLVAVVVLAVLVVVACVSAVLAIKRMGEPRKASPRVAVTKRATASVRPTTIRSASPTATASRSAPSASARAVAAYVVGGPAPRPPIVKDYITFGAKRRAETATYARRHYGTSDITLHPKVVVLHYTDGSSYESAHATFESNAPNMGVLPGTVAHFVIDRDGTIYQQLPLDLMGRHAVGVNYCAIGIESVQPQHGDDASTVAQILARPKQRRALVALVRWLMYRYHIPLADVIGHGMANDSPYFKDLLGWTNDHADWQRPQVLRLRALLR